MTNFSISNQLPIFLGTNGTGLNNGKVYIGQPNQDPQTFPKTVYWDEAGTDPVDQTNGIPTIGGYITRAGSPATIYMSGYYSIRLRDRFGAEVYYFKEVADLSAVLAAPDGSSMIGFTDYQTVKGRLDETLSVGDDGATAAAVDNGTIIETVLTNQKQSTSISYGPATIPMDPRKSVSIADQYVVKNLVDLWAKTTIVAPNALNSGMTLAADATGDRLIQFGGSTGLPAWGNQNNIQGGAYNILKAGAALVRKNPSFPRAYNAPGGSFMTNWNINSVSFAGPYGVMLGDVYSQQAAIRDFHCVGTVEQILSVQGNYILIDGLDKTGFTGTSAEPLVVLGDPDNINPTTNITLRRAVLDLNGSANKDSVVVINARTTLIDDFHNELTFFNRMLRIKDSIGTKIRRASFVTGITDNVVTIDNSDVDLDLFEPNTPTGKWWNFFERLNKPSLVIGKLRQFFSAVLPIDEDIKVGRIQNVGASEREIDVPYMNIAGNFIRNPAFVDGATGFSVPGTVGGVAVTATIVSGNKVVPNGKILRITVASDATGLIYISNTLSGMAGTEWDDRAMTTTLTGEVTGTGGASFMCPVESSLGVNQGRIYSGQGLVKSAAVSTNGNGVAYIAVVNPRAAAVYDIHFVSAQQGRQVTDVLPVPMQPLVADPIGGATVDDEARAAITSLIGAMQEAGIMRTTT